MKNRHINKIAAVALSLFMAFTLMPQEHTYGAESVQIGSAQTPDQFKEGYIQHNCLDLSEWNRKITDSEWNAMKTAGVDSVILRAGYSTLGKNEHKEDACFEENIENAYKKDMNIGVYYFSSALTEEEAKAEAEFTLTLIDKYREHINLPVAYDFETNREGRLTRELLSQLGKEKATSLCKVFCNTIKENGFTPMVYASREVLDNYVNAGDLDKNYEMWLAQYTEDLSAPQYKGKYAMWQYSSHVYIDGVKSRLDANYLYEKDLTYKESGSDQNTDVAEQNAADNEGRHDILNKYSGINDGNEAAARTVEKEKQTINKIEATKGTDKEHAVYKTASAKAKVPVTSTGNKAKVQITDKDGLKHSYTAYKADEYTNDEAILATLFTGYFTSKHEINPKFVKEKVIPKTLGKTRADNLPMEDIQTTLQKLSLDSTYTAGVNDNIYVDIKSNLAAGRPVIIKIQPNTSKWSYETQTMLLLGMDETGKAIVADTQDRAWSENSQRVKLISVDELVSYMTGNNIKNCGGYITINQ